MYLKTCLLRARLGNLSVSARCTSGGIYDYATHANGATLKVVGLREAHVWSVAAVTRSAHETSTGLEGRFWVGPFFVQKTSYAHRVEVQLLDFSANEALFDAFFVAVAIVSTIDY